MSHDCKEDTQARAARCLLPESATFMVSNRQVGCCHLNQCLSLADQVLLVVDPWRFGRWLDGALHLDVENQGLDTAVGRVE